MTQYLTPLIDKQFFVTITHEGRNPVTVSREAKSEGELHSALAKEFGDDVSFQWSEHGEPRPVRHVEDWEAEGRRIVLESMDLPDGAYFAMAEELGIDP
jgi:hypothetical protein